MLPEAEEPDPTGILRSLEELRSSLARLEPTLGAQLGVEQPALTAAALGELACCGEPSTPGCCAGHCTPTLLDCMRWASPPSMQPLPRSSHEALHGPLLHAGMLWRQQAGGAPPAEPAQSLPALLASLNRLPGIQVGDEPPSPG